MRAAHKAAILLAVLLLCSSGFSADKNAPVAMKLALTWRGKSVTVSDKHLARTFFFDDDVDAYQIHTAKLQSAREAEGFIYLLFDLTGWSMGSSPIGHGYCGSGEEKNLIWLKLDTTWKPVDKKSVLYASCTQNIELHDEDDPAWSGDVLSFSINDYGKKETRKIEYSLKEPDKGLQVTTEGTLK